MDADKLRRIPQESCLPWLLLLDVKQGSASAALKIFIWFELKGLPIYSTSAVGSSEQTWQLDSTITPCSRTIRHHYMREWQAPGNEQQFNARQETSPNVLPVTGEPLNCADRPGREPLGSCAPPFSLKKKKMFVLVLGDLVLLEGEVCTVSHAVTGQAGLSIWYTDILHTCMPWVPAVVIQWTRRDSNTIWAWQQNVH